MAVDETGRGRRPTLARYSSVAPAPVRAAAAPRSGGPSVAWNLPGLPPVMGGRPGGAPRWRAPNTINGGKPVAPGPSEGDYPTYWDEPDPRRKPRQQADDNFLDDYLNEALGGSRTGTLIQGESDTVNGVNLDSADAENALDVEGFKSLWAPLDVGNIDANALFLFDRGAPTVDLEKGTRVGVLQSRGVYGSADSLERANKPGTNVTTGSNLNRMTVAGAVKWLRGLSVRDKQAYNELVIKLRNAGFLNGDDHELPLGGYDTQVGAAFALASTSLAQANEAGDERTLEEYLNDRASAYEEYLKEREAEQAKADAYQPVERRYEDPAALRAMAYDAARSVIGRKLTDEEEAQLTEAFRAKENSMYDGIDAAGEAEGTWSGYVPSAGGQVDDFLDSDEYLDERREMLMNEYGQVFRSLVGLS